MNRLNQGFTAVELLVAIIIAMFLLGSAFQLYTTVLRSSASAQYQATASNVAYDLIRQHQSDATKPCTTSSSNLTMPSYAGLANATATLAITCPFGTTSYLSLVKVTVNYYDPNQETLVRALVTYQ